MVDIKKQVDQAKNILLTTHRSPDGDAIGSVCFLYRVLRKMGKEVRIYIPDAPSANLLPFLKGTEFSFYEEEKETCDTQLHRFDLLFHLDYNATSRVGAVMEGIFEKMTAFQIMIDHHPNPTLDCGIQISKPAYSSTAELLFDVVAFNGWEEYIDTEAAKACYLGMLTDTGSFRYPSVTSNTHRILAFLLDLNISHHSIHEAIYDSSTLDKVKLRAYAVVEKLEIIEENIGIISLSNEELRRFHYQKGDTEGLVNVILSVEGINVAVLVMEKEEGVKISFRSKGEYFVNDFAQKYFQGGGHKYAAGGFSSASIQETLEEIKKNCIAYF